MLFYHLGEMELKEEEYHYCPTINSGYYNGLHN